MNNKLRRIMRLVVVGLFAALPAAMAPCDSPLQYPTSDTNTVLGVAIDQGD